MRFVVDEEALGRVSLRVLRFCPLIIIPTKLHTHSLTCHLTHVIPSDQMIASSHKAILKNAVLCVLFYTVDNAVLCVLFYTVDNAVLCVLFYTVDNAKQLKKETEYSLTYLLHEAESFLRS